MKVVAICASSLTPSLVSIEKDDTGSPHRIESPAPSKNRRAGARRSPLSVQNSSFTSVKRLGASLPQNENPPKAQAAIYTI